MDNLFDTLSRVINTTASDRPFSEGVLEEEEYEALIMSLAKHRNTQGFTDEEAVKIIRWAESQRIGNSLIELVCKEYIFIDLNSEEEPVFGVTEKGKLLFGEGINE